MVIGCTNNPDRSYIIFRAGVWGFILRVSIVHWIKESMRGSFERNCLCYVRTLKKIYGKSKKKERKKETSGKRIWDEEMEKGRQPI